MPDPAFETHLFRSARFRQRVGVEGDWSEASSPRHGPGFNDHVTLKTVDVFRVGADWKFGRSLTAQSLRGMSTVQRRVPLPRAMVRWRPYAQVFAVE